MTRLGVLFLGTMVFFPFSPGDAATLCARRRNDGTLNAGVKVREACKPSEIGLDPIALGLQGPTGPKGDPGEPGTVGPTGPAAADISVRVFNSAPISVPSDTDVVLTFDSERWDTAALHDPSQPTRLVAPVAGKYILFCNVSFPTNAIGRRGLSFRVNGAVEIGGGGDRADDAGHHTELFPTAVYELAAGDYVEAHVAQDSGSTLPALGYPTGTSPECGMVKIG